MVGTTGDFWLSGIEDETMNLDLNPILTLVTIISGLVTAWALVAKQRNEARTSEATIAELITKSAGEMLDAANEQARLAADKYLEAVKRANTLEAENLKVKRRNAGLVHEVEWLRVGVDSHEKQLGELGAVPNWDSKSTKPLFTPDEVEEIILKIRKDNGLL